MAQPTSSIGEGSRAALPLTVAVAAGALVLRAPLLVVVVLAAASTALVRALS
jgi:hypothetical protein